MMSNNSDAVTNSSTEENSTDDTHGDLLTVRNLKTQFSDNGKTVHAVDGISFEVRKGEILGIVGESGCGKSVTSLSLMKLIRPPGEVTGEVLFKGKDLLSMSENQLRKIRGNEISIVFQEPESALNPVFEVGWQIGESLRVHKGLSKKEAREKAIQLLDRLGIPGAEQRVDDYPYEFSGGMSQRAMIAMAIACDPDLLIADEPTTNLDVTIEAQILDLLVEMKEEIDMSVILITHDLGVAAQVCDRIAVMYAGRIVEYGKTHDIFEDPRHPYTRGLLGSLPVLGAKSQELTPIPGELPDPANPPEGCNFCDRCEYAIDDCESTDPKLREVAENHYSACIWDDPT